MNLKKVLDKFDDTDIKLGTSRSLNFFQAEVKNLKRISRQEFFRPQGIGEPKPKLFTRPTPGKIYFFNYDPKWKKDLPFYDRWPLVLVLETRGRRGFLGMNFHYLPPGFRADLFKRLLPTVSDKEFGDSARIGMDYTKIKRLRLGPPLFKEYLNPHLRSKLRLVKPKEWEAMLFMPIHQFMKVSDKAVWGNSLRMLSGRK